MPNQHFISYSRRDGQEFAFKLHDALEAGSPSISMWLDQRDLRGVQGDWDTQIAEAIGYCETLLFVMTEDSVRDQSVCKLEWARALSFKKPVLTLLFDRNVELPFRLGTRHYIDFTTSFDVAIAHLREELTWLTTPEGILHTLNERLGDAERDLQYEADEQRRQRIESDIEALNRDIAQQQDLISDPQAAKARTEKSIQAGIERERTPKEPLGERQKTKFINPPPGIAPSYFQDRHTETRLIGEFLKNDAQRLITVIGRGGIGKTAIVCRLLKSLESGRLPDDDGNLAVKGIVYLSGIGSHRLTTPNLYADLSLLLLDESAQALDNLYKTPTLSTETKMRSLLEQFPDEPVVLLLDNFEDVLDQQTRKITDTELDEALNAILNLPQHGLKVIITSRVAPRDLLLVHPERQKPLHLDEGLPAADVKNMLREMDTDGKYGLNAATDAQFDQIYERTRGYPRALEALYAALAADRDTMLDDMLSIAERFPDNVVQALVGEAFNRLDTPAQSVMQALAIYARPVTPAAIDYLLQANLPEINSAPILGQLVNMQFVRRETGRYYLHPVDRDYALTRIRVDEESEPLIAGTPSFNLYALRNRAANYFKEARKPRQEWKTLEDLAPQLDEFDLYCIAGNYDAAATVVLEIDFNYLYAWGFYHAATELHLRVQDKIEDLNLKQRCVTNLGRAYWKMGQTQQALTYYEQALTLARNTSNKTAEGSRLGNLGICYGDMGRTAKAIDYFQQAIVIFRDIHDTPNLGRQLAGLGAALTDNQDYSKAITLLLESLQIANDLRNRRGQCFRTLILSRAYLYSENYEDARQAAAKACQRKVPEFNHMAHVMLGIVAARQNDAETAQYAFATAVHHADQMLTRTAQNYDALDAKWLALCGLALCEESDANLLSAVEALKQARLMNPYAGIVNRVSQMFEALAVCDMTGMLAPVREELAKYKATP